MKVTTIAVVASSIWSVTAQNRADFLPECALKCLDDATQKVTSCSLTDAVCWCVQKNYEDIYNAGVACVLTECGNDKALRQVLPGAAKFCAAATASAQAASSTPAPTATASPSSSGATGNNTATITSSAASSGGSSSSTATPSTASPGAAATSGPIAGAAILFAGILAVL
ncbi:hypothetical protein CCM_02872 [Cordyceps militaris CM01]|uniref:CFEM domain-containing protein n=1 Tax=Cordyceps militaris (strain CM01) TaxID=983644 RepID=G3JCE0_CORMM|nr:uncharacterized protein CCM_02872 [Cordyceps militaris CM01]EGX94601.1 hypothetical protein CCM_02872 [Cordyceps militaris CM01]